MAEEARRHSHVGQQEADFGISLKELRELMELRGNEANQKVIAMGGVQKICTMLNVSPLTGTLRVCSKHKAVSSSGFLIFSGLHATKENLEHRKKVYGANIIPPKPSKTFLQLVWEALQDATLIILELAAIISLILWLVGHFTKSDDDHGDDEDEHGWIDSVAIIISIFVVVFVTAFNDYTKERQFRGLQKKIEGEHNFAVIRDNSVHQVCNTFGNESFVRRFWNIFAVCVRRFRLWTLLWEIFAKLNTETCFRRTEF
jgi:Ca2+ transporting ATPase